MNDIERLISNNAAWSKTMIDEDLVSLSGFPNLKTPFPVDWLF